MPTKTACLPCTTAKPMNDPPRASSAIGAVRCLYLARVVRRLGHQRAADRWNARAMRWLERVDGHYAADARPAINSDVPAD